MSVEEVILNESRVVAVVGLSSKPDRPSFRVASYLKRHGYRIIPVNPMEKEVMGETCYPDLASVPGVVDVVAVFRRSEDVPPIVEQAIAKGVKAVWMQEGIVHNGAAELAGKAGLKVVMDKCMRIEHARLHGD